MKTTNPLKLLGLLSMIERHVTFNVQPDMTQEFVNLYGADYRPAMASVPGSAKADLLCEQEKSQQIPNDYGSWQIRGVKSTRLTPRVLRLSRRAERAKPIRARVSIFMAF